MTSSWFFLSTLNYDARSTTHQNHFNVILPSLPKSSKWSLYLKFPQPKPCMQLPPTHSYYMPRPSHSSESDHPNCIWWAVQIRMLLIMQYSPPLCYLVPRRHKYLPQHDIPKHPQLMLLSRSDSQRFPYLDCLVKWYAEHLLFNLTVSTVIPRLTKMIRSGITFVSRNLR